MQEVVHEPPYNVAVSAEGSGWYLDSYVQAREGDKASLWMARSFFNQFPTEAEIVKARGLHEERLKKYTGARRLVVHRWGNLPPHEDLSATERLVLSQALDRYLYQQGALRSIKKAWNDPDPALEERIRVAEELRKSVE